MSSAAHRNLSAILEHGAMAVLGSLLDARDAFHIDNP
jgi:hypothetical protein